ncbi:MAG TPA: hypothetical protein VK036_08225, partial [Wenzhouxiangella sp.]|nr:hypothetical protein [Wenzhouxiangella sp.]
LLTVLMVVFGWLRTEQSAWWNILAWTLRNGATLAPVVAALFWPLATRRAVVASMLVGFASGLSWYWLSNWSPTQFYLGIHPVWIGMSANLVVMVVFTLAETLGRWRIAGLGRSGAGWSLLLAAAAVAGAVVCAVNLSWLLDQGLFGLSSFAVLVTAVLAVILQVRPSVAPSDEGAALPEGAA